MLFRSFYGNGKLAKLGPAAMKVVKQYPLPRGEKGLYTVHTDGAGIIGVNEIDTDTLVHFDPRSEHMRAIKCPGSISHIRKMTVDRLGRLCYLDSHNGPLGVVG